MWQCCKSYPTPFTNSFTVVDVPYSKPTPFHKYGYQTTTKKLDVIETKRNAASLASLSKMRTPSLTRANPGVTKHVALGSEKAIGLAFELFQSKDDEKCPKRIRLFGPTAATATATAVTATLDTYMFCFLLKLKWLLLQQVLRHLILLLLQVCIPRKAEYQTPRCS